MKQEKKSLPHKEYGMMMSTDALRSLKETKANPMDVLKPKTDFNLETSHKLVSLSHKRKHRQTFLMTFADPQDHNSNLFTNKVVGQGDDVTKIKTKTYVAPELQEYSDPYKLPAFLREKLSQEYAVNPKPQTTKKPKELMFALEKPETHTRTRSVEMKKNTSFPGRLPRESILKSRAEELLSQMNSTYKSSTKKEEIIEYQYFSPKARQEMNSNKMPVLMTNVFLTGMVNPEKFSPKNEATVEYIISEHHGKAHTQSDGQFFATYDNKRSAPVKKSIALNLVEQNKKVKKRFGTPKDQKNDNLPYFETQIVAAVDQLKSEREKRKEKVLRVLKTRNFNLFKPSTINNMHLLKDALRED